MSPVSARERMPGPILAVCGLAREARIAAGPGIETIQAGGSPARLRVALEGRTGPTPCAVISFGIAGGIDPTCLPGDVVIAAGLHWEGRRFACDAAIARAQMGALDGSGLRIRRADLVGVEAAVTEPSDKAALHAATGAAAVDMESQVAAAYAAELGLPFAALRVVCDPADRALPRFAAQALKPNGEPDVPAVLAALLRREARIGQLVGLARDSGAAFRSLGRARALLGLALGVDA